MSFGLWLLFTMAGAEAGCERFETVSDPQLGQAQGAGICLDVACSTELEVAASPDGRKAVVLTARTGQPKRKDPTSVAAGSPVTVTLANGTTAALELPAELARIEDPTWGAKWRVRMEPSDAVLGVLGSAPWSQIEAAFTRKGWRYRVAKKKGETAAELLRCLRASEG